MSVTATPAAAHRRHPAHDGRLLTADAPVPRVGPADPLGPAPRDDLDRHHARLGPRPRGGPDLVDDVEAAALTGRGGAAFPVAGKWRIALSATAATVVANAAESEPLSAKDGTLLRQRPHLVLDGLAITAEALGAARAVVWLHGDDDGAHRALAEALAQRRAAVPLDPVIELVRGPSHLLAGESGAIARALDGGPALPRLRRGPRGHGPVTVVHNAETLARVGLLARGLSGDGTRLLTVLTPDARLVVEVARGTPTLDVLRGTGLDVARPPEAVLLGGLGGTWLPWREVVASVVDDGAAPGRVGPSLGRVLGPGVLAPIPPGSCGLAETAAAVAYLARMSARQCGPCLFGLPALGHALAELVHGRARAADARRLVEDLDAIRGRGACHHPDATVGLVRSALDVFAGDVVAHLSGRPCVGARTVTLPVPGIRA